MADDLNVSRLSDFDEAIYNTSLVVIKDKDGSVVFSEEVEFPYSWSETARNIVASRWFRTFKDGSREKSLRQMIERVAGSIVDFADDNKRFEDTNTDPLLVQSTLEALMENQILSFSTPHYLQAGWADNPCCSACFLLYVDDTLVDLTDHLKREAKVFASGGGTGINLSNISQEGRKLSGGGFASGPLSFERAYDRSAGAIKSGGASRRAARDVTMNIDHPDCYRSKEYLETLPGTPLPIDFISEKSQYEMMRRDLMAAGWPGGMNTTVDMALPSQNANRAVGVSDEFMAALDADGDWPVKDPRTGEVVWTYKAADIWNALCTAAWESGDPTVKFLGNINGANTTVSDGKNPLNPISCSNPCNEILYAVPPIPGSGISCNLAHLRLTAYLKDDNTFDDVAFVKDAQLALWAMDQFVDYSTYPTSEIDAWTKFNRILGLGFSDLGALLMRMGVSYDSHEGRVMASAITALLFSAAAEQTVFLAAEYGQCGAYGVKENEIAHRKVWKKKYERMCDLVIDAQSLPEAKRLAGLACDKFRTAIQDTESYGVRNMQLTALMPTGTTGLAADVDSTGPEPLIALEAWKQLSGGGYFKQAPECVRVAVEKITGESCKESDIQELSEKGTLRGVYYEIFETALGPHPELTLSPDSHIDMLAWLQPFICGGISKTVNIPNGATVKDVSKLYKLAHRAGVKAVSIYRDGCKGAQPVKVKKREDQREESVAKPVQEVQSDVQPNPVRRKLPYDMPAVRHRLELGGFKIYLHASVCPDGSVGEIFISGIEGSTVPGLLDSLARSISLLLQYGAPFEEIYKQFIRLEFVPNGFVAGQFRKSFPAYIMETLKTNLDNGTYAEAAEFFYGSDPNTKPPAESTFNAVIETGELCTDCGGQLFQAGRCKTCSKCGSTKGGCA